MARRRFGQTQGESPRPEGTDALGSGVCGNKLFYAERVKTLRKAAKVTQAELAGRLGLSRSAVLNWESGRTRPDISNIPSLCRELHVPIAAFFSPAGEDTGMDREETRLVTSYREMNGAHRRFLLKMARELQEMDRPSGREGRARPRLLQKPYAEDPAAAGVGAQGFEAACSMRWVHDTPLLRNADILFRVNGDSMAPAYPDGCTVALEKKTDLKYGEIGVFSVDGTLFIKEYRPDGLHSLNRAYPVMQADRYGEIRTIGRVTGVLDPKDLASQKEIADLETRE